MRGAAALLLLLLLFAPLHANVIAPTVYEQKDLGDPIFLHDFTYSLSADCTAATISIIVMDDHNVPVEGAYTYLKYVDFSSPLLAQGPTDREGFILDKLPGSSTLMRGLFILVIEKKGFRNKEVHFDISGCYSNKTAVQPAPPAAKPPANNTTSGQQPGNFSTQPSNITIPPPANMTNMSGTNQSGNASAPLPETLTKACPFVLLAVLVIAIIAIFKSIKRGKGQAYRGRMKRRGLV